MVRAAVTMVYTDVVVEPDSLSLVSIDAGLEAVIHNITTTLTTNIAITKTKDD